jgi:hypothetical protein
MMPDDGPSAIADFGAFSSRDLPGQRTEKLMGTPSLSGEPRDDGGRFSLGIQISAVVCRRDG